MWRWRWLVLPIVAALYLIGAHYIGARLRLPP
jgi:hypothetical protein